MAMVMAMVMVMAMAMAMAMAMVMAMAMAMVNVYGGSASRLNKPANKLRFSRPNKPAKLKFPAKFFGNFGDARKADRIKKIAY